MAHVTSDARFRRLAAVAVIALLALWPQAEHAQPPPAYPSAAELTPQIVEGPVPLIIAWERARCPWPTLVLYDDHTWLRAPSLDTECALALEGGQLQPDRGRELVASLTAAVRRAPRQTFVTSGADWNTVVVAARDGSGYRKVWVEALLPRRPRAFHERAAREPVEPLPGAMLPSLMYAAPLPESVLHLNDLLTDLALHGDPFVPRRRLVSVTPDSLDAGAPRAWPDGLPESACRAAWARPNGVWLPAADALESGLYRLGRLGCRVSAPTPALPAHETLFDVARLLPPA